MIPMIFEERLSTHLRGVWGYLRVGLAICGVFFITGGVVALIQNGHDLSASVILILIFLIGMFVAASVSPAPTDPPKLAAWLLVSFLPDKRRREFVDDLHQAFNEVAARSGVSTARAWYWSQVVRSLPYAWSVVPIRVAAQILAAVASIAHFFIR
jgi:FtsH-binding integral membrane protein